MISEYSVLLARQPAIFAMIIFMVLFFLFDYVYFAYDYDVYQVIMMIMTIIIVLFIMFMNFSINFIVPTTSFLKKNSEKEYGVGYVFVSPKLDYIKKIS